MVSLLVNTHTHKYVLRVAGVYSCPCYYYPSRSGTSARASFVVAVDLRAGDEPPEHWTKRGSALLMSLDQ